MSLSKIAEASLVNNEAALHYGNGHFIDAMAGFRRALESVISLLSDDSHPQASTETTTFSHGAPAVSSSAMAALNLSQLSALANLNRLSSAASSDEPFLFERPIVFEEILGEHKEAHLIFLGVVVFNMAITSHARARTDPGCLVKALRLYDVAIDFFYKATGQGAVFAAVVAVALNNKLRIYYDGRHYEDLERDAVNLNKAMVVAERSEATWSILQVNEFENILLNILFLRRPAVAEAA